MNTNELHKESSPYLLQHAQNPVHWKAWNDQSLQLAQNKNKLIVISIGYSACHWCHVMEHESFESEEVAEVMNAHFINIKIDREERPDVDSVYMKAVQLMTRQGGWPLNVVTLPNGKPIWGGTYFRKEEWVSSLKQLNDLYQKSPERIIEYAEKLHQNIQYNPLIAKEEAPFTIKKIEILLTNWRQYFDNDYGGMAAAPKFMMPNNYQFLLRMGYQTKDEKLLDFVNLTLTKMAYGGIFDAVGGGFSRYSVDVKWHVPHFEKMLYDNAQLVSLYSNAFKLNKNPLYQSVVEKTLTFIETEFLTKQGGFYSALDADSIDHHGKLIEGAYYVWTKAELIQILGTDFELFAELYNINAYGYWEDENYVLIQNSPLEVIAENNQVSLQALEQKIDICKQKLYQARSLRPKPRLDDKCLTSWNALMLLGYVDAYKAFGNPHYLKIAIQNGDFISQEMMCNDFRLFRNFKNGKASINAFLEDYATTITAFIALYEVTTTMDWLGKAKHLTDYVLTHFYDSKTGFFAFTSNIDQALISTHFETEDNVIPASNSMMAKNLYQLGIYFNDTNYSAICSGMVSKIIPTIDYPSAYSNWLDLALNFSLPHFELGVCGPDAVEYLQKIQKLFLPNVVLAATTSESDLPFLSEKPIADNTQLYLCQQQSCDLASIDLQQIINKILK